jgi:prepilin-type N-terminal cleavage/methylation domain-containing protein
MTRSPRRAWTMIEMVVVLGIITVLISFVYAAVDRALYWAELGVCQANQKSIGTAVHGYAAVNHWRYPYRPGVHDNDKFSPVIVSDAQPAKNVRGATSKYDDRPMLGEMVPLDEALNCPMVKKVSLEKDPAPLTRVYASQALWFGWQFQPASRNRRELGMFRLGGRFTWEGQPFALLASDWTAFSREDNYALGSHPDYYDGVMSLETATGKPVLGTTELATFSFWVTPETWAPGPVDRTFLYDDGSVLRLERVVWRVKPRDALVQLTGDDQKWNRTDDRMVRVPERAKEDPTRSTHLPK